MQAQYIIHYVILYTHTSHTSDIYANMYTPYHILHIHYTYNTVCYTIHYTL